MKKYKIALVCDWFLPRIGGIELHLQDLGLELTKRGHEVHVITSTPNDASKSPKDSGLTIHRISTPLLPGWRVIYRPKVLSLLREILRREKFDVIHGHSIYSPLTVCGITQGSKMGIPTLITNHSLLRGFGIMNRLARWTYSLWANRADLITAVSRAAAEDTQKAFRCEKVLILPNGINPDEWGKNRPQGDILRIASVMRLYPRKRPQDLVRVLPHILEKLPHSIRPLVTIVGDGPLKSKLEREVRRHGLEKQVSFLGYCPREKIRALLSQSDLFVLPTLKEAFGISVLEARSSGLPVVAMNHGGVGDLIQHGKDGFLANNFNEFIDYIVEVIQNEERRKEMQKAASMPLQRFSWEAVIDRHLEIYGQAVAMHPHPNPLPSRERANDV